MSESPKTRRLSRKGVRSLTADEARECEKLCYSDGQMRSRLRYLREEWLWGEALRILSADGELLAWALVSNRWDGYKEAFFYVPPRNRRRGYGTRLARAVARRWPRCKVHPWNRPSIRFFQNFPELVDSEEH